MQPRPTSITCSLRVFRTINSLRSKIIYLIRANSEAVSVMPRFTDVSLKSVVQRNPAGLIF